VGIILYYAANEGVTTGAGKLMIDHLRWRQLRIGIVMEIGMMSPFLVLRKRRHEFFLEVSLWVKLPI